MLTSLRQARRVEKGRVPHRVAAEPAALEALNSQDKCSSEPTGTEMPWACASATTGPWARKTEDAVSELLIQTETADIKLASKTDVCPSKNTIR